MDAIADRVFSETVVESANDDPSLLTVILDISPAGWYSIKHQISIQEVTKSLLVFLNAHLALNNSNLVAFITSSPQGSKFLYPNPHKSYDDLNSLHGNTANLINDRMYRQFRVVDETILQELNLILQACSEVQTAKKSTLTGAVSLALTYTNRMLTVDQSISTTTASAISSTTKLSTTNNANSSASTTSSSNTTSITSMKSRILIVSPNDEEDIKYIPIMNSIFAAQKMKVPIDIAKLGTKDSSYLQQASDATSGIYLHIEDPKGLIQVLSTAYFIEPSIRPYIILPTNSNVNYRASCFITGKSVDLAYVCSVCLCIMSVIPNDSKCPACGTQFDEKILADLTRAPVVSSKKKRKLINGANETPNPNSSINGSNSSLNDIPTNA